MTTEHHHPNAVRVAVTLEKGVIVDVVRLEATSKTVEANLSNVDHSRLSAGVIVGHAHPDSVDLIRQIHGVIAVEVETADAS